MSKETECQICNSKAQEHSNEGADKFIIDCPRCGNYEIDGRGSTDFMHNESKNKSAKLSHYIRIHFNGKNRIKLNTPLVKDIFENFELPKPMEQADNLILWIGNYLRKPDGITNISYTKLTSIIGAIDEQGVDYIGNYLASQDFIIDRLSPNESKHKIENLNLKASMTIKGWERYYEILHSSKESTTAFMAMAFGDAKLNELFSEHIKPSVSQTGFQLKRLDDEPRAGIIDNLLRVEIRKSKFLIADLSTDNRGAYWEAGFAEGLGKEVIYICEKTKFDSMHFDTNHLQTVIFEWDKPDNFTIQLKATIRATFPNEAKMED